MAFFNAAIETRRPAFVPCGRLKGTGAGYEARVMVCSVLVTCRGRQVAGALCRLARGVNLGWVSEREFPVLLIPAPKKKEKNRAKAQKYPQENNKNTHTQKKQKIPKHHQKKHFALTREIKPPA